MTDVLSRIPLLRRRTIAGYALGGGPDGIKVNMFAEFLLLYYSQLLGLNAALAGLAIAIALVMDAFSDPAMGSISDHAKTRIGRRHPFMIGAVLPLAACYCLLFLPREFVPLPQGEDLSSHLPLFLWLTAFAVGTRLCMTTYIVPFWALGAELTPDYHRRTAIMGAREMATWLIGVGNALMGFFIFFRPTVDQPLGQLVPDNYERLALAGATAMIVFAVIQIAATWGRIPFLPKSTRTEGTSLARMFEELKDALGVRNFSLIFFGTLLGGAVWGVSTSLTLYVATFFWGLDPKLIGVVSLAYILGAILSWVAFPLLSRRFDKVPALVSATAIIAVLHTLPVALGLSGVLPSQHFEGTSLTLQQQQLVVLILFLNAIPHIACVAGAQIMRNSLTADIVDEQELLSGDRREGSFFALKSLLGKFTNGAGVLFAGSLLALIGFSSQSPSEDAIIRVALIQGPLCSVLLLIPPIIFSRISMSSEKHASVLEELAARSNRPTPDV